MTTKALSAQSYTKILTNIEHLSNRKDVMSFFLYQLPSHLWDGLMVENTSTTLSTSKIWLKPCRSISSYPSHKWDGN